MQRGLVAALFLLAPPAAEALAGTTRTSYAAAVVLGYDSNPLEVSARGEGQGDAFGQLRLAGELERGIARNLTLFADGDARLRMHGSSAADADTGDGTLRGGLAWSPARASRLLVATGGRFAAFRGTYTDRATGEVFTVSGAADPGADRVLIGDRLDRDSTAAFLNLRWKESARLRLFLDADLERTNYVEDYAGSTALEPLDFRAITFEPGVSVQVHESARVIASVARTDLDYDRQSALDEDGDRVTGQTRSYDYLRYRLTLQLTPAPRWTLWFGGRTTGRSDAYAGYYDYHARSSHVALDRDLGTKAKLVLQASFSDLEYDNATIAGQSGDGTLDERERVVLARFERSLKPRTRWFVEGGARRSDSRDPDFAHAADWLLGGIEFRQ